MQPLVYRKTWWIQTSTVWEGANPYTGCRSIAAIENFKPNPIGSYRLYIETYPFSYEEGRFLKRKTGTLANKVKEN
jgi:hypothetical protein